MIKTILKENTDNPISIILDKQEIIDLKIDEALEFAESIIKICDEIEAEKNEIFMNKIVITIQDRLEGNIKCVDLRHSFLLSGEDSPGLSLPPQTLAEQIGDAAWEQTLKTLQEVFPTREWKVKGNKLLFCEKSQEK